MSMTASNGPAESSSEPRNAIAFDAPAPVDGKGVGETGSSSFEVSHTARSGPTKLRDGSHPALTDGRTICRGLGLQVSRRRPRLFSAEGRSCVAGFSMIAAAAVNSPGSRSRPCRPGRPGCSPRA
jgi:hypothetical protein